jgi:hypothetical protein
LHDRDPQLRLGAWENPPKDIMNSSFFSKISWDAIYERRQDGPWLPDLPGFYRRSMYSVPTKSIADGESSSSHGNWNKIDFTPPPFHRMTEENQASEKLQQQNRKSEAVKKEENNGGEDDDEEEEEEEDEIVDEEEEEELAVRDSIFISNQNEVPGWSYIDEEVLMSYITSLTEKKGEKKEKKKKVKKSVEAVESVATASVSNNNESVSQETSEKVEAVAEEKTAKTESVVQSDDVAASDVPVVVAGNDDNIVKSESVETN